MFAEIIGALLPAIITILLGYFAAWHHDFSQSEVPTLNRMVMTYALPLALFVGVLSAGRDELVASLPLVVFLILAMAGTYLVVLLVAMFVLHHPPGLSALRALMASAPSTAFVGVPVLGYLYGPTAEIPIAVGGIIISVILLPMTLILLALDSTVSHEGETGESASAQQVDVMGKVLESLRKPIVWLPCFGFVLVMLDMELPSIVNESLSLLGHSSSGVALFTAGIILAGYKIVFRAPVLILVGIKNIVQPAIVCLGMIALGYTNPLLSQTVVTTALPAVTVVVMLAVQYRIAIPEAASALLISTFGSLITMSVFIWLVK